MATVGEAPTRAGRDVTQPSGHRALLPPQPARAPGGELQGLIAAEAQRFEPTLPRDVDEVIHDVRAMNHRLPRLAGPMRGVRGEMTCYARNRRFRDAPYIALFNGAGPVGGAAEASAQVQEEA